MEKKNQNTNKKIIQISSKQVYQVRDTKTKNVSKEAIERNTMTKVQSDVNVIMKKSDDYVLQNMGSPYSTIYSLKIDKVKNFEDLKKMGVVLKRALYFITCKGIMMYPIRMDEDYITRNLLNTKEKLLEIAEKDGIKTE